MNCILISVTSLGVHVKADYAPVQSTILQEQVSGTRLFSNTDVKVLVAQREMFCRSVVLEDRMFTAGLAHEDADMPSAEEHRRMASALCSPL